MLEIRMAKTYRNGSPELLDKRLATRKVNRQREKRAWYVEEHEHFEEDLLESARFHWHERETAMMLRMGRMGDGNG